MTAASATITDEKITVLETTSVGPLGGGLAALVIGRSSASKQGLFVIPGLIDVNYSGVIKIMLKVFTPPVFIPRGSIIAQLIPFFPQVPPTSFIQRTGGLGSTGPLVAFTEIMTTNRPTRQVMLQLHTNNIDTVTVHGNMMLDTGADVTVVPVSAWPSQWPLRQLNGSLLGIAGVASTWQSVEAIQITDQEGNVAITKPYVLNTPLWLLGRDVLSQRNVVLTVQPFPERPLSR